MGARLAAYYAEAENLAGLDGKIQLAMLTRIPSTRALVEPDSADNLAKFENAMWSLRRSHPPAANAVPSLAPDPIFSERVSGTHRTVGTSADGENLFWGVLGSLHDAMIAVFDREAVCLLAWESRSLEKRYAPDDPNVTLRDSVARLLRERLADAIREVADRSSSHHEDFECELHGQKAWLSVTLSAAHGDDGRVLGVHAFIQDITERKQHETALLRSEQRLREHTRVYVELLSQKAEYLGDLAATLRRVTEAAACTLDVARASVWLYDESKTKILCADLFERASASHAQGIELHAEQFPTYFEALLTERSIPAHDAHNDPRTACFSEPYLKPLGINSMLDVPIWVHGAMVGVVCHEHTGPARTWTADEESFAYMMGSLVALSLELAKR